MKRIGEILGLFLFLSLGQMANASINENTADTLIDMEMLRLHSFPGNTALEITKQLTLGRKIAGPFREGEARTVSLSELREFLGFTEKRGTLTGAEKLSLLATLRILNATLRGKEAKTAINELIEQELKQLIEVVSDAKVNLDESIKEALKEDFKRITGKEITESTLLAEDLHKVLRDGGMEKLSEEQKKNLLANTRIQAFDQKGDVAVVHFDNELRNDLSAQMQNSGISYSPTPNSRRESPDDLLRRLSELPNARESNPSPQLSNSGSGQCPGGLCRSGQRASGRHSPGGFNSRAALGSGNPFSVRQGPNGSSGRGGDSSSIRVPNGLFTEKTPLDRINPDEKNILDSLKTVKTSLLVTINGSSACQLTLHKSSDTGNGTCKFVASSAKHCFDSTRPILSIEGIADQEISQSENLVRASQAGGDMVAVHFTALRPCNQYRDLPVFDVADPGTFSSIENQGFMLASRWGYSRGIYNLAGRLSNLIPSELDPSGNSVLQADVRDRSNNGMGTFRGDSGGGAFVIQNGRPVLVGVLSQKIEGQEYRNGIGFIASKGDTAWLWNQLQNGSPHNQELARSGATPSNRTHFDSNF